MTKQQSVFQKTQGVEKDTPYSYLDLPGLARLVVDSADRAALCEIHANRRVFRSASKGWLLFTEYLHNLRARFRGDNKIENKRLAVVDRAYDLTVDKFFHIPEKENNGGVDCRHYYRAFVSAVDEEFSTSPPRNQVEGETKAGALLQGLVNKHFQLSIRQAFRESECFRSRYRWQDKDGSITVWMPRHLHGEKRRQWLEQHVENLDASRPGEKERVQAIIDSFFPKESFISLFDVEHLPLSPPHSRTEKEIEASTNAFAAMVAEEKAQTIHLQRPAIRGMGSGRLKQLVLRIFEDIRSEEYEQKKVASEFGISTATLSRFAGSDWKQKWPDQDYVPDLWRNTAQVISQIPAFREVAEETGMLGIVTQVNQASGSADGRGVDHE